MTRESESEIKIQRNIREEICSILKAIVWQTERIEW